MKTRLKPWYSVRSFASYITQFKFKLFVTFLFFAMANLMLAIIPVVIGKLVGTASEQPLDTTQLRNYAIALIICSTGHDLLWRCSEFLYLKLIYPLVLNYEAIIFNRVIKQPYPYFVDKFSGKVSAYINTLVDEFRMLAENVFWEYVSLAVSLISVTFILFAVNIYTGAIFLTGLVLMILVGRITLPKSIAAEQIYTDINATKTGKIVDILSNFVNVKSFQTESSEIAHIAKIRKQTIDAGSRSFFRGIIFWGSMSQVVRNFIWPTTILLNVYLFSKGIINIGELTTFLTAILIFSDFIWDLIWTISQLGFRLARFEESHTYLFGPYNIMKLRPLKEAVKPSTEFSQSVSLTNLDFAYPDKPDIEVLKSLNLEIKKGEKLGIVGKSGSGKTTITKLLLDYYQLEPKYFYIDGHSVSTYQLSQLISYVPQDTTLFHRSIADNIAYAADRQVTNEEIKLAAKQAHADEFISNIDKGYQALVGERGVKLSAGQRQRIAIARAFLDNKPILILDEATSALDSESEALVQDALEALWHNKTVIAIAHRLSTLKHMDRIIVMEAGRIAEQGTHEQLLQQNGIYAKLWAHQTDGFLDD